jgi:chromosome segregation ATPase
LVASLLGLVLVPLIHNRAVRLTMRRLEAATPFSMAEIQAEKDQLRAEFAMSTRRLEMSIEQLKGKTTSQLGELGKKSTAINKLKSELSEKSAALLALEAREKTLRDQLRTTEEEYSVKTNTMHDVAHALTSKENELSKLTSALSERTALTDSQRVEIAALRAEVEALKAQCDRQQSELHEIEERLRRERSAAEAAGKELGEERGKTENFTSRIGQLERQLVAQTTEAEILGKRVQELEARLTDQGRMLVEREYDARSLRGEADKTGSLKAEKEQLQQQLEAAREDGAKAKRELAAMKHDAEATWATERVENALLRERINDIAAEVARLTSALEGPDSPIEAILAETAERPANGIQAAGVPGEAAVHGDLVERIRALQSRASRIAAAP